MMSVDDDDDCGRQNWRSEREGVKEKGRMIRG